MPQLADCAVTNMGEGVFNRCGLRFGTGRRWAPHFCANFEAGVVEKSEQPKNEAVRRCSGRR
jgi:hypothetical protein